MAFRTLPSAPPHQPFSRSNSAMVRGFEREWDLQPLGQECSKNQTSLTVSAKFSDAFVISVYLNSAISNSPVPSESKVLNVKIRYPI